MASFSFLLAMRKLEHYEPKGLLQVLSAQDRCHVLI
jgi:hypothetical protein